MKGNAMISMTAAQARRNACSFNGAEVTMEPRAAAILSVLLLRRGEILHPTVLLEMTWPDPDCEPDYARKMIHIYVYRLRGLLPGVIRTVAGWGYVIDRPGDPGKPEFS